MTGGEVQICLTWNFADNVDTSQYRYKNQLPFSARSCHINDKSCLRSRLQPKLQRLHHHSATLTIMCLVFHRVTHLTALFVILGFYPLLKSARHLDMSRTWHNDTWGSRIVSPSFRQHRPLVTLQPTSVQPGEGRTHIYRVSWYALTPHSPLDSKLY